MENVGFEKVRGTECLYRYRPNGKYYARFVVNGKEVRRSLRTSDRDIAKRHVLQIRREAAVIDPQASKITLAGLCNRYLPTVRHQAAKTVAQKPISANVSSRNGRADRTCLFGKFFRRKCKLSC